MLSSLNADRGCAARDLVLVSHFCCPRTCGSAGAGFDSANREISRYATHYTKHVAALNLPLSLFSVHPLTYIDSFCLALYFACVAGSLLCTLRVKRYPCKRCWIHNGGNLCPALGGDLVWLGGRVSLSKDACSRVNDTPVGCAQSSPPWP